LVGVFVIPTACNNVIPEAGFLQLSFKNEKKTELSGIQDLLKYLDSRYEENPE
jgi:hypothetical protein